jgi:hypothetical protein
MTERRGLELRPLAPGGDEQGCCPSVGNGAASELVLLGRRWSGTSCSQSSQKEVEEVQPYDSESSRHKGRCQVGTMIKGKSRGPGLWWLTGGGLMWSARAMVSRERRWLGVHQRGEGRVPQLLLDEDGGRHLVRQSCS